MLSIRRFPRAFTFEQLVRMGTVDPDTADLLRALVRARMSIVVSGGTSSGKTTLLNALSGFIPAEERIVTIEDSAELQLQQPHVISLEARPPNVEGKGQVTIRDLVRNALRMRPDRIVVGEVRGPETIDMLQAMNTGHDGSLTTVHANSTEDSVVRMQTLASMSEVDVPFAALRDQINSAIDVIVQLERSADGRRRIVEVAAVSSRLREDFRLATIMRFDPDPIGADRVVTGTWVHYPLPDVVAERLRVKAEIAPAVYTEEAADELEAPERASTAPRRTVCLRPWGRMPRSGEPVTGDQAGLLVLAGTLVVATAGAWDLLAAGATREELRERATGERAQLRSVRLGDPPQRGLRAHAAGPPPAAAPRRRRGAAARPAGGADRRWPARSRATWWRR